MVFWHVVMSLDGFIAGPGHDMSWTAGAEYDTSSQLADEVARSTGVVLAGRGWYEVASADEGGAVAVARQVLALGRLDEIIVQIVPIVIGNGERLFGEAPAPRVTLERTYVGTSGTLTDMRFRVAGPPMQ